MFYQVQHSICDMFQQSLSSEGWGSAPRTPGGLNALGCFIA